MKSRIWRLAGVSLLCLSVNAQVLADERNDSGPNQNGNGRNGDNHERPGNSGQGRQESGQEQRQQQDQQRQQQGQQQQRQQQGQQQRQQQDQQRQQQVQQQQRQQQEQQHQQDQQRQQQQRLPIQSRPDEVRQTQQPRQGYYQDNPRQGNSNQNQHWQSGNSPRPGGGDGRPGNDHWQGRPDGHGNGWGPGPQYRPGYEINRMPSSHSRIGWRGQDYFYSGGYWYRPQGPRYVIVTPPYGIRVRSLPSFSQEVWLGSTLFFLAAGTYYLYQAETQDYVVATPPQGVEPIYAPGPPPQQVQANGYDPVAYPVNGQGPEQQQQDMYDCHMWGVNQSGFDPAAAAYAPPASVADIYRRSMAACLAGRGYSVN
ncbi:DUF6515 family protein [Pseudomonas sp. UMAB-08]|uniref:DUF6515 family protein n=1 Tax=Pseudomonas sp. UMAB-08 TaxID=1365375 RepID=UPI001C5756B8|nr:DUF6515 family protein [Pseudomonas sp. UMAB-08]